MTIKIQQANPYKANYKPAFGDLYWGNGGYASPATNEQKVEHLNKSQKAKPKKISLLQKINTFINKKGLKTVPGFPEINKSILPETLKQTKKIF